MATNYMKDLLSSMITGRSLSPVQRWEYDSLPAVNTFPLGTIPCKGTDGNTEESGAWLTECMAESPHNPPKKYYSGFSGQQVKEIRLKLNLSRRELAEKLCVSPRCVESWEQSRRTPSNAAQKLLKIAAGKAAAYLQD